MGQPLFLALLIGSLQMVVKVTAGNPQSVRWLQGMRANFVAHGADGVTATRKACGAVYDMVEQPAAMLAFMKAFLVMGVVFLLMLLFLPLLPYSKEVCSATLKMAVEPPDIPQDWQGPLEHQAHEEEHDLVSALIVGYGFKAKFPLILRAQLGEIANPRLWYSIAHHRTGWPWGLADSTQVSLCRRSHP